MHARNGIVLGFGSIGKKHAKYLSTISDELFLVDPIFELPSNTIKSLNKKTTFYKSISEIGNDLSANDIAVVANWGPDHLKTIVELTKLDISKIVLEKPCVDSLEEIDQLRDLYTSKQLQISVNQGWYYENLSEKINHLSKNFNLGEVVAIWVTGGARCLSTAGSHWLSLANQIYSSDPTFITADASNSFINPRSKELAYIEGVFSFTYSRSRRLGINLSNSSSIEGRFEIYWRDAVGELISNRLKISSRNEKNKSQKVTLYGPATELIFDDDIFNEHNQFENLYNSFQELNKNQFKSVFDKHLNANKAILLALVASDQNKKIKFTDSIEPHYYKKKYGIS